MFSFISWMLKIQEKSGYFQSGPYFPCFSVMWKDSVQISAPFFTVKLSAALQDTPREPEQSPAVKPKIQFLITQCLKLAYVAAYGS